jgi:hypothetical protein
MNARLTQIRTRPSLSLLAAALAVVLAVAPSTARANAQIYQQTLKSTTWIIRPDAQGFMTGTGVLVDHDRRLILTNYHVVGEERECTVFFPQIQNGKVITDRAHYFNRQNEIGLKGRVVAIDRKRDVAIIQLPSRPDGVQPIEFAGESVVPGSEVQSIGNAVASDVLWVFTSGTVRAVYPKKFRTEVGEHEFTVIETQSPINPGDSGGPVVNNEGKLVGISQSLREQARLVSYCVDISELKAFLAEDWKPAPLAVADLMNKTGLQYKKHELGPLAVDFPVEGSGPQSVFISNGTEYYGKAETRKIWSLALSTKQALAADVVMTLLEQNSRTKMGAWTIERNPQGVYLVIFCVQIDATASA